MAIDENGSPRAIFETTDDRLTFLVTIPVHDGCEKSSETPMKSSETQAKSSETQTRTAKKILEMIRHDTRITASEIAMNLGMSTRGVEKNLRTLREAGFIKRIGSPTFGGHWEIIVGKDASE